MPFSMAFCAASCVLREERTLHLRPDQAEKRWPEQDAGDELADYRGLAKALHRLAQEGIGGLAPLKDQKIACLQDHASRLLGRRFDGQEAWLITSLSPSAGEKMSKHSLPAGEVCGL
jgi:hypothetical protein